MGLRSRESSGWGLRRLPRRWRGRSSGAAASAGLLLSGGLARSVALAVAGAVVAGRGPSAVVYLLAAVESSVSALMRPTQNALLPALAQTPEELTSANLALSMIESGGAFLGPLAGAAVLRTTSMGAVFFAAASAYLLSALLTARLDVRAVGLGAARAGRGFVAEAAAGVRSVALTVVLICGAQNLVAGALNVLIVVTALRLLGMAQSGVGTLTAALGVGGLVGGAFVLARLRRRRHGLDLGIGLLLWGAPLLLLALTPSKLAAFALLGVVGIGVTVVDVAALTLLQRGTDDGVLPHALALLQTVFVVTVAVGTLLAPILVSTLGIRGALIATGLPLPVLSIGLGRRLRELDDVSAGHAEQIELLSGITIFAPLSDGTLEHLARALRPLELGADEPVFRQGDRGDDFYVIAEGQVEVVQDGDRIATLGPRGYFGEIALLRDIPRTAAIRTMTPSRLLLLERARFLAAVTGTAASADAADAIVGARLGVATTF